MRGFFLGFVLLCVAASPAATQQLATVHAEARVRIPDFLTVQKGETSDSIRADGTHVRRVTLYVTANRTWNLEVVRDGSVVDVATGGRGNAQPVSVEIPWKDDTPPDTNAFDYLLTAS